MGGNDTKDIYCDDMRGRLKMGEDKIVGGCACTAHETSSGKVGHGRQDSNRGHVDWVLEPECQRCNQLVHRFNPLMSLVPLAAKVVARSEQHCRAENFPLIEGELYTKVESNGASSIEIEGTKGCRIRMVVLANGLLPGRGG